MKKILLILLILSGSSAFAQEGSTATPTSSPTPTASPAPTVSASPAPTASPTPTPSYTPNPELLAWSNAVLADRPWLQINGQQVTGIPADQATLLSRHEPIVTKSGADWVITFKP